MESAMAILQSLSSFTNQLKEVNAPAPDPSGVGIGGGRPNVRDTKSGANMQASPTTTCSAM
jgi:hypothetical protein